MKDRKKIDFFSLSAKIWITCIVFFILTVATSASIQNTAFKDNQIANNAILISLGFSVGIGIISFIIAFFGLLFRTLKNKRIIDYPENTSKKVRLLKTIVTFLFLPLFVINNIIQAKKLFRNIRNLGIRQVYNLKSLIVKTLLTALSLFLIPIWILGYILVLGIPAVLLGLLPLPSTTLVTGNSMLPTITDGTQFSYYWYNKNLTILSNIQKKDIVIYQNESTVDSNDTNKKIYYIKRVIATEGDTIEFRDGFVLVNNQIVEEPYTLKPRSTFGNKFLGQCESITIPKDNIFVLGDNRQRSQDSRYIGLVNLKDIQGFVPFPKQNAYSKQWRDASKDTASAGMSTLDKEKYYELFNKVRQDNGIKSLKVNTKLEEAAKKRAEAIIKYNELKISPDNSKYPIKEAHRDVGYSNIAYGEISTYGYFDTEDLANYWMDYNTKESVLNKDYQETGIAAVIGEIDGCQNQIIVQEFGGYIPPNYKQSDIDSWQATVNRLREILPSWEKLKSYPSTYNANKQDTDRLLEIINIRISRIDIIVSKMKANKWLTNKENQWTYDDEKLYKEQETLAKTLNSIQWK